ncbi:methylenetetrahydrofolate reductase [Buchnera aphidicola (Kurisakia onigurumii)]|uniref:methylenetetrahydrofolate reductase n=1 Tax=Buchnera aphidicola TaxID=9 RepID=UPI0031B70969
MIKNNIIKLKKPIDKKKIHFSFEFFPPKDKKDDFQLNNTAFQLSQLKPNFFSVTHGANNGETNRTYNVVKTLQTNTKIITAAHLTCINYSKNTLKKIARKYWKNGITRIVALRGDIPNNNIKPNIYALNLVKLLKKIANFDISVAAYPEVHPEAINAQEDLIYLKKKMEAGANRAITQFFFDTNKYLKFRDKCEKIGIKKEIIPGILPVSNSIQLYKFSQLTNVHIPKFIHNLFQNQKNPETGKITGAILATDMINKLKKEGVQKFHFYTLNKSDIIYNICKIIKYYE